ncbi:MAG: 5-formyltetrahydrofolate cyclo-ligase [Sphingomonadaceae bacterium]|nr:5-formyltetrahydrofolate cyclo-ligase [Sphingomonadaceae bacterium]
MTKAQLRKQLRAARKAHVAAQPDTIRALLFLRPPSPLLELVPQGATVGVYRATADEAPANNYAKFFAEAGHRVALPSFATPESAMVFREHTDPFGESDLEAGPFGMLQPTEDSEELVPELLVMPLVGFTASGARLGQGGGHYDRWLAAHSDTIAIGIAWDCQLVDELPLEDHDMPLKAVVTPTRFYGTF